jgi:protein SCO1/2
MKKTLKLCAAALLLLVLAACGNDSSQLKNISGLVPDLSFEMTDDSGHTVDARSYRGDVVLLYFGYTHCPDICPTTLARLASALYAMHERGQVRVLFVTVDPARDTVPVMHQYVRAFGPEFTGLRGTADALHTLAKRYRVTYSAGKPDAQGNYDMTHSDGVFVFDKDGHGRLMILPDDTAKKIAADLDRLAGNG